MLLYPDIGLVDTTMTKLNQHGRLLLHQAAAGDRVKAIKILVCIHTLPLPSGFGWGQTEPRMVIDDIVQCR